MKQKMKKIKANTRMAAKDAVLTAVGVTDSSVIAMKYGDVPMKADIYTADGVEAVIRENLPCYVTSWEVLVSDKDIPAGIKDTNDQTDDSSLAKFLGFDNTTATGLTYLEPVSAGMIEMFSCDLDNQSLTENKIISAAYIDWGDGTPSTKISDLTEDSIAKVLHRAEKHTTWGTVEPEDDYTSLILAHKYLKAGKYIIKVVGKDVVKFGHSGVYGINLDGKTRGNHYSNAYTVNYDGADRVLDDYNRMSNWLSISPAVNMYSFFASNANALLKVVPNGEMKATAHPDKENMYQNLFAITPNLQEVTGMAHFFDNVSVRNASWMFHTLLHGKTNAKNNLKHSDLRIPHSLTKTIEPAYMIEGFYAYCANLEGDILDILPENGFDGVPYGKSISVADLIPSRYITCSNYNQLKKIIGEDTVRVASQSTVFGGSHYDALSIVRDNLSDNMKGKAPTIRISAVDAANGEITLQGYYGIIAGLMTQATPIRMAYLPTVKIGETDYEMAYKSWSGGTGDDQKIVFSVTDEAKAKLVAGTTITVTFAPPAYTISATKTL